MSSEIRRVYEDQDPGDEDDNEEVLRWIEADPFGALMSFVKSAGRTMTLYGKPVSESELRQAAEESWVNRVTDIIVGDHG